MSVPGLKSQVNGFMKALDVIKNPEQQSSRAVEQQRRGAAKAKAVPSGSGKKVEGYEMQDITSSGASSAPIPYLFLVGFLLFLGLIMLGWRKRK